MRIREDDSPDGGVGVTMRRLPVRAAALIVGCAIAVLGGYAAGGAVPQAQAHSGTHPYQYYPDKWYQLYSDSGSYSTWMTLTYDVHYDCSGCSGRWSTAISNAVSAWNSTDTTIYYSNAGAHNASHDVHIRIISDSQNLWGGKDVVYDENYDWCTGAPDGHNCPSSQSRPDTWWYEYAYGNDYTMGGETTNEKKAVIIHELGHGLSFDHTDAGQIPFPDGFCFGSFQSLMDYDCLYGGAHTLYAQSDVCGVNHRFYDPNWGYSGCQ